MSMNNQLKKFLREQNKINNIREVYTEYGVNNANDAYKLLDKKYKKEEQQRLKEASKEKARIWSEKIRKEVEEKNLKIEGVKALKLDKFIQTNYANVKSKKELYEQLNVTNAGDAFKKIAKQYKAEKMEKKQQKRYDILYSNEIRIDADYENKGINYKINDIELTTMKRKVKKQNVLFQQEILFYDNNGKLIDKVVTIKGYTKEFETINGEEKLVDAHDPSKDKKYDFKTMKFETNTINKEFIQKVEMNMVDNKDYAAWKPDLLLSVYPNGYTKIITKSLAPVEPKKNKKQTYRDNNVGTCVYDGVVSYFESLSEKNKNAKAIYNKLIQNKDTLAKEYTDETIETELAPFCKASVTIKNLINGKDKKFNENTFNRFNIEFLNTKYNHLDLLAHNYNEIEEVTKEQMKVLKQKLPFYIEKYGTLITLDKTYKQIDTEFQKIYKDWKTMCIAFNKYDYDKLFIYKDTDEYKMVSRYDYKLHTFFNAFEKDNSLYKEIDLKKAYYNYSNKNINKHYKGVPSGSFLNVSCDETFDFEEITENGLIGFYEIKIIDSKLDERLGLTNGSIHYLFTSMIELLLFNDVKIEFLNASYSPSAHIPFHKAMLGTENDLKHYCKAFGLMLAENSVIDIKVKPLKCDRDYFETINDENLTMYQDENMIKLQYQNKKVKCYTHIAYAIHAYTQTLILEQLLNMDLDYVFGVKLDSIVYKKDYSFVYKNKEIFDDKECKIEGLLKHTSFEEEDDDYLEELNYMKANIKTKEDEEFYNECLQDHKSSGYYRKYIVSSNTNNLNFKKPFTQTGEYINKRVVFFGGAGGTGKTFSCLNNLDLSTTCYTTMCWNLIQGKMEEYKGTHGHSIPQLTGGSEGFKCEQTNDKNMKHIIIDEATLLNKLDIIHIIHNYPNAFIFILGDVDEDGFYYQASVTKQVFNPSIDTYYEEYILDKEGELKELKIYDFDLQYIKYTKTFRFDEILNNKLNLLRDVMKKVSTEEESKYKQINVIIKAVKDLFSENFKKIEDVIFNDNDIGICCKDDVKNNNEITNYFIEKGTTPQYYIKKTIKEKNQMRGQQILELPTHNNYECKLFKTIHSFQGLDLSHDNKIIIVIDSLFDENLLYTALSRARRQDQIVIIDKRVFKPRKPIVCECGKTCEKSFYYECNRCYYRNNK